MINIKKMKNKDIYIERELLLEFLHNFPSIYFFYYGCERSVRDRRYR